MQFSSVAQADHADRTRSLGALSSAAKAYCDTIAAWPPMVEWLAAALAEPEEMEELDVEF